MSGNAQVYKDDGETTVGCDEHGREVKLSWGRGYPKVAAPVCPETGHTMNVKDGALDPWDSELLEDAPSEGE